MYDIVVINRSDNWKNINYLKSKYPFLKVQNTKSTELETVFEAVKQAKTAFVWVLTDHCNYSNFNFEIRNLPDQEYQIYSWLTSNGYYETFLIPVKMFLYQVEYLEMIDHYKHINWQTGVIEKLKNENNKLDVVFLSNGEPYAEQNYFTLKNKLGTNPIWIKGIDDRTRAIKTAAAQVSTVWFYLVPAKLSIAPEFDFDWHPNDLLPNESSIDCFKPFPVHQNLNSHYVFYAHNTVNDLIYGHMAVVLYNTKLVIETKNPELDFTMSMPNIVVPKLSGYSTFNETALSAWRTAFRETVKLKYFACKLGQIDAAQRLEIWLTRAQGINSDWCLQGAKDGVEYYLECNGDLKELEKTYYWDWLNQFQKTKGYNL